MHLQTLCMHACIHIHIHICPTRIVRYDWEKSPCDPRYAPPEQFIDDVYWSKYDLYCVGLILVSLSTSFYMGMYT
jgi:hypothetical protein